MASLSTPTSSSAAAQPVKTSPFQPPSLLILCQTKLIYSEKQKKALLLCWWCDPSPLTASHLVPISSIFASPFLLRIPKCFHRRQPQRKHFIFYHHQLCVIQTWYFTKNKKRLKSLFFSFGPFLPLLQVLLCWETKNAFIKIDANLNISKSINVNLRCICSQVRIV